MTDTVPLVSIDEDFIVIRIPIAALPRACEIAWEKQGAPNLIVSDLSTFAKEFVGELCKEKENGDTIVTDMLDLAANNAANSGAFGIGETPSGQP